MVKNVGPADRYLRFMVGIAFLLNIIILEPGLLGGLILFVIGALLLFSSYTGSCYAYTLLKIDTCAGACKAEAEDAPSQSQES